MTIQSISEEVRRIQKKYGESDPFRLAQAMKIIVVLKPMGRYKGCCKGILCSAPQNQTYHNQQRFTGSDSTGHTGS